MKPIVPRLRTVPVACLAALSLGLTACGNKEQHPTRADNEAVYVDAGPLTYQVQISRELNPSNVEDQAYLAGVPAAQQKLQPNQLWFAVFMWAKNQSGRTYTTTSNFDIVDTQGHKFYPVGIDATVNGFAWIPQALRPGGTEPDPDSVTAFGPTQGRELLFKLDDGVYDNRPLDLEIYGPGQTNPSTVALDL